MFHVKYILFYTLMERNDFVLWFLGHSVSIPVIRNQQWGRIKKRQPSIKVIFFLRSERGIYLLFLNFLYSFQPNTIPSKTPAPVLNNPENRLDGKLVVNEDGDVPNS